MTDHYSRADNDDELIMRELIADASRHCQSVMQSFKPKIRGPEPTFNAVFAPHAREKIADARSRSKSEDPFAVDVVGYEALFMSRLSAARTDEARTLKGAPSIEKAKDQAEGYRQFRRAYELATGTDAMTDMPLTDKQKAHFENDIPVAIKQDARAFHATGSSRLSAHAETTRAAMRDAHDAASRPVARQKDPGRGRERIRG